MARVEREDTGDDYMRSRRGNDGKRERERNEREKDGKERQTMGKK